MNALEIKPIWWDRDGMVKCHCRASNGSFAGEALIYSDLATVKNLGIAFQGFPTSLRDSRTVQLGTLDPAYAGGGVRLEAYCMDRSGHAVVAIQIVSKPWGTTGTSVTPRPASASFVVPIEPAAIDRFCRDIEVLTLETGSSAKLLLASKV